MGRRPKGSKKRRWIRRIAIGSVVMVVFSIGMVELTSQNFFCNTCHIMNPFYESWKVSTHRHVHCVECHIPPGVDSFVEAKLNGLGQVVDDTLNRTSTKPSAAVSAMACMRSGCHTLEEIAENEPRDGVFKFDHSKHFGKEYYGIKIDCTTCHSHVQGDEHFELNTNVCILCHVMETDEVLLAAGGSETDVPQPRVIRMAVRQGPQLVHASDPQPADPHDTLPPSDCRSCHEPPRGEFMYRGLKVNHDEFLAYGATCESCHQGVTTTPQPITDAACLDCHTFGVSRSLPTEEIHKIHNEGKHKIECFSCHGMPEHGPEAQSLHVAEFDCYRCHVDQHAVQRQTYLWAGEAVAQPDASLPTSPMFLAHVDCTGCHLSEGPATGEPHNGARVVRASAEGCDNCHQPGLGEQMIPLWQNSTRALYDRVSSDIAAIDVSTLDETQRQQIEQAHAFAELVRMDGSWGVHNPRYTQRLLEQARDLVRAVRNGDAAGGES